MHDDGYFDERVAATYDDDDEVFAAGVVEPCVDFLAALAAGGPVLEFGVGTGRIALPLAERGLAVHGVDMSRAMVARLQVKPGGDRVPVTIGDLARTAVDQSFAVVYLVFNTIMNLTSQDEQVACFGNAARHLKPGGHFVVEVMVPQLRRLPPGDRLRTVHADDTRWTIDEYDVVSQGLVSHHFEFASGSARRHSVPFRYVWPAELDLMARLAGLTPRERWSDWQREPFTAESDSHVSVWTK